MDDRQEILTRVGEEMRAAREELRLSQQSIAEDLFDWQRDAISKFERGLLNISLVDFLILVDWLHDGLPPTHPALVLRDRYLKPKRGKTKRL